ncbi:MAG: acyl-CoA synthetase [Burkholderiales bacterium]|nr:acyl-CoA synthetase [Burkholderiales bacterium]
MYNTGLDQNAANYVAMTPLDFIERAATVYGERTAIVHGALRQNWRDTYARCRQLASALAQRGIRRGDTVAVMLPNTPPMVEAHFGVPMCGAVLNTLNTRLDADAIAFMLDHGEAKAIIVDREFSPTIKAALERCTAKPIVIDAFDAEYTGTNPALGSLEYEALLTEGDPAYAWVPPQDEWDAIALNYTSGTTGNPKGVVYHHRGAYINAINNIVEWDMPKHTVYLWALPLFHCNGWCLAWSLAARAGVNVCLRRVDAKQIFDLIRQEKVTHYCGAPIVHGMLANSPAEWKQGINHKVSALVGGAAPSEALLDGMERMGFELTQIYGLTEVYGPASVCVKQESWNALPLAERARLNARQGVRYPFQAGFDVMDPTTMQPVPHDGETMGEIMFRGNICMKGYLKNEKATQEAFAGGWFHSGDLAVIDPDGYVKIKDRSKDIIISGGENISSIEVEEVLYKHPAVLVAAVVARNDEKWGETPCAFVELKPGETVTSEELIAHCRQHLAGYKLPKTVVFGDLPKTATGKIQKYELRKRAEALNS